MAGVEESSDKALRNGAMMSSMDGGEMSRLDSRAAMTVFLWEPL